MLVRRSTDALFASGKVHGSLARAGKVRGQTPKVEKQEKKKRRLAVPRDDNSTIADSLTLLLLSADDVVPTLMLMLVERSPAICNRFVHSS